MRQGKKGKKEHVEENEEKGSTKMEISSGKNLKSGREKIGKSDFAPPWKFFLLRPCCPPKFWHKVFTCFAIDHNYVVMLLIILFHLNTTLTLPHWIFRGQVLNSHCFNLSQMKRRRCCCYFWEFTFITVPWIFNLLPSYCLWFVLITYHVDSQITL